MDAAKMNDFALVIATRMQLGLLPINKDSRSGPKALLYFIGCLPGGISETWLKKMLKRDSRNVEQDLPCLLSFDLVSKQSTEGKFAKSIILISCVQVITKAFSLP